MGLVLTMGLAAGCGADVSSTTGGSTNSGGGQSVSTANGTGAAPGDAAVGAGGAAAGGAAAGGAAAGAAGGGGAGDGGQAGSASCIDVSGSDYGACEMVLGWGYDGNDCVHYSGCSCDPNCQGFHKDLGSCIKACATNCDASAFLGLALKKDGWGVGDHCDDVFACTNAAAANNLESLYPQFECGASAECPGNGMQFCRLAYAGTVDAAAYADYCEMTLVDGVDAIYCSLYGP